MNTRRVPFTLAIPSVIASTVIVAASAVAQTTASSSAPPSRSAVAPAATGDSVIPAPKSFTLDNGLRVILATGGDGRSASVAVLFGIGELHDPPGRSGMARLMEQLFCTAAVGRVPARSIEDIQRRYPAGNIDQAFSDHSVIGIMIPKDRLLPELAETAARLAALRVEETDLAREKARLAQRIRDWSEERPGYAAIQRASFPLSPLREGAPVGGALDQMAAITLEEAATRLKRFYRPANTTLVVAGAFDVDRIEVNIRELFGALPAGEAVSPVAAREAPPPPSAPMRRMLTRPADAWQECHAAVAVRPPAMQSPDSVAFAVLAERLFDLEERDGFLADTSTPAFQAYFLDPNLAFVLRRSCIAASTDAESPDAVLAAIGERLAGAAEMTPEEFDALKRRLRDGDAWMVGACPIPMRILVQNPYGVAYALGRHAQLGIDPASRAAALEALDSGALFEACGRIFSPSRFSRAIITTAPPPEVEPTGADAP